MPKRTVPTELEFKAEVEPAPSVEVPVEVVEVPRPPRVRNEQAVSVNVPFKSWFIVKLNSESRLKPHHAEGLFVYFAGRGLQEEDAAWRYDAALREYFGS